MNKRNKVLSIAMLSLLVVGLVSAGVISHFGRISQNIEVTQGLYVDGHDWDELIETPLATTNSLETPTFVSVHYLENRANVEATVDLVDTCSPMDDCEEITTDYYETNLRQGTLELSKKDGSWIPLEGEGNKITVTYSTDVETGITTIDEIDTLPTEYTLIYYADEEFTEDGVRLATPGQAHKLEVDEKIPISSRDGNLKSGVDYCAFDSYEHCRGIKLWAIRTTDLSDSTITWNANWQSEYYFETDILGWNHNNPLDPAIITAGETLDFVIVSDVPASMTPDIYTITTSVSPQIEV